MKDYNQLSYLNFFLFAIWVDHTNWWYIFTLCSYHQVFVCLYVWNENRHQSSSYNHFTTHSPWFVICIWSFAYLISIIAECFTLYVCLGDKDNDVQSSYGTKKKRKKNNALNGDKVNKIWKHWLCNVELAAFSLFMTWCMCVNVWLNGRSENKYDKIISSFTLIILL